MRVFWQLLSKQLTDEIEKLIMKQIAEYAPDNLRYLLFCLSIMRASCKDITISRKHVIDKINSIPKDIPTTASLVLYFKT